MALDQQYIYEQVTRKSDGGVTREQAFHEVALALGERQGAIAAAYYRERQAQLTREALTAVSQSRKSAKNDFVALLDLAEGQLISLLETIQDLRADYSERNESTEALTKIKTALKVLEQKKTP